MKRTLLIIANLIAFTCGMRLWVFNIPPRIFIFNLLSMLFVILFILYYFLSRKKFLLNKELKYFILFLWVYLFIVAISGVNVMLPHPGQEAYDQYFKIILLELFNAIFFTSFILFYIDTKSRKRHKILAFYIAGVICSCLYGMIQMLLLKDYGINIDYYIWSHISYNAEYTFVPPTWVVMGITRGEGFPGVNAGATYVVTILPLLLLRASHLRKYKYIVLFIIGVLGLLVTMSRTGMMSFIVALLALIILEKRRLFKSIKTIFIISIPFGFLAYFFGGYIHAISKVRSLIDYSRLALFKGGFYLFYQHPLLGIGANNYSVVRFSLPNKFWHSPNLHSSWLTILVELGVVGLLYQIIFFVYIIYVASRRKNLLSRALISTIIGLSAGAFVNQVFDLFYFNFYVVLVFAMVVLEDVPIRPTKKINSVLATK